MAEKETSLGVLDVLCRDGEETHSKEHAGGTTAGQLLDNPSGLCFAQWTMEIESQKFGGVGGGRAKMLRMNFYYVFAGWCVM